MRSLAEFRRGTSNYSIQVYTCFFALIIDVTSCHVPKGNGPEDESGASAWLV